eukprot:GFUD01022157.1.p1 GENE.GFUD01022157.1~~GFUD01022157.1.p1  ORF type:complete len:119 (+),score=18.00 GFUD01022157.1:71-427(+)
MFSSAFLLLLFTGFANSCCTPIRSCLRFRFENPPVDYITRIAKTYRRPKEGCAEVERVLNLAVKLCPNGSDRFTWAEVENCAAQLYRSVILKEDDFEMMDANGDGVLTIEEWKEFEGC